MRQAQHGRKIRGRGRKPNNPLSRTYDSAGPDTKVRGTAAHVAERYVNLARDAQLSGDRVTSENYLQHAEHYIRIVGAAQEQQAAASQQAAQAAQPSMQPRSAPQNGHRTPSRSLDEPDAVNGQSRDSGDNQSVAENSADDGENTNRRGGRRRPAKPSPGDDSAVVAQQPQVPEAPATAPTPAPTPTSVPAPASATPPRVDNAVSHDNTPLSEALPVADKVSDELVTAASKPAPKRRRRTKPVEEVPAVSDQAAPEPSSDPVN